MKPENKKRPVLLLEDDMPVRCMFVFGREECEQSSTVRLIEGELVRFQQWLEEHPRSDMWLRPGWTVFLCDTHEEYVRSNL